MVRISSLSAMRKSRKRDDSAKLTDKYNRKIKKPGTGVPVFLLLDEIGINLFFIRKIIRLF
jgi:hypothetical protein